MLSLLHFGEHPIAHRFLTNPAQDEYVHPVDLFYCEDCGLIQLVDPIPPDKLYTEYNWLSSWKWNPHLSRLLSLIDKMFEGLEKTSKIVEVGSNDGTFLEELRGRGYENFFGIEPTRDGQETAKKKGIETVRAYFTPETAQEIVAARGMCDLLVARQVLEHVVDLKDFREAITTILRPGGYLLIEVPNFDFSLNTLDYSAIWEEHVNYFTLQTLKLFLANAGIRLLHSETAVFSGEALFVLGEYTGKASPCLLQEDREKLRAQALAYRDYWPVFRDTFINYLQEYRHADKQIAVYGAGCRACSLINYAGLSPYIDFLVDDQPEKQGKYMPGAHLPVMPGEALETRSVDLCLLSVNAENEDNVVDKHPAFLERGGLFLSMNPASKRLLPFWGKT